MSRITKSLALFVSKHRKLTVLGLPVLPTGGSSRREGALCAPKGYQGAKIRSPRTGIFATLRARLHTQGTGAPSPAGRLLSASLLAILALFALTATPALAAPPETPELTVLSPVKATEASFHGILNPEKEGGPGTFEAGTYQFLYKQGASCVAGSRLPASPAISLGGGKEEVSQTAPGLTAGTEYTVCLLARNGTAGEEALSTPLTFTTATPAEKPETKPATGETGGTAILHGVLNPIAEAEAGWYFAYSAGAKCTSGGTGGGETAHEAPAKVEALSVEREATGLEPNRSYKFCLVATNTAEDTTPGNELPLKTLPLAPAIASEAASEVKSTGATLEAQINPNNENTKYTFEYSTKASGEPLVLEAPIVKVPGAAELEGFPEQRATVALSGLEAGKTYFYRVLSENEQSKIEVKPVAFAVQSFTTVPTPSTDAPTALSATTVTFHGHLTPLNGKVATQYHFNYKLGAECGESGTPTGEAGTGAGTEVKATANVTELQPNAEYTVCFVTSNASGSLEGAPVHFTTPAVAPKILSEGVSGVTPTEATLEARVNPNNQEIAYKFEYATNPALTGATSVAGAGPLSGFSAEGDTATVSPLTGLKVGETYYYRIVVENTKTTEVIDGATQSLTPVGVPLVSTGEVQNVTATAVRLPGTVNPAGSTTAYHVAYISQAGYEEGLARNPANPFALAKVTLEERSLASGFEAVPVELNLRELTPATTYEAILVAENATGTTRTAPTSFTTAPAPPAEGTGEPAATGPAPVVSPFPAATLPPFIPYASIAELNAKEAKETPKPKPSKPLTKAQKRAKALKACTKKPKKQRATCRRQAKRRYR
jgi:hypothetical protein